MREIRIGAVSYLNTVPLISGLDGVHGSVDGSPCRIQVELDFPGRLADRLRDGEFDAALIPSVELFRNPDYTVVSDACIACRGPVWSVKLFSRVPFSSITSLTLDAGSRTSALLVQALLAREFQIQPATMDLAVEEDWRASAADAVLLIGDRAIRASAPDFPWQKDLGEWWLERTGLPFVFAMWCARPQLASGELRDLGEILSRARDRGVALAAELAKTHAPDAGLSEQECLAYFQHNLHFTMGPAERSGLRCFQEMVEADGLVSPGRELQFHGL